MEIPLSALIPAPDDITSFFFIIGNFYLMQIYNKTVRRGDALFKRPLDKEEHRKRCKAKGHRNHDADIHEPPVIAVIKEIRIAAMLLPSGIQPSEGKHKRPEQSYQYSQINHKAFIFKITTCHILDLFSAMEHAG